MDPTQILAIIVGFLMTGFLWRISERLGQITEHIKALDELLMEQRGKINNVAGRVTELERKQQ